MKLDRTFRFRGNRNYLHSASVINDLLSLRGENVRNIDLKFHRKTLHQVSYTDESQSAVDPVAEWSDAQGKLYLVEREERISEREPYDEQGLVGLLEADGKTVRIPAQTPNFTRADAIVAAFKHLLQTVYPDVERKYVFVRIRMDYCPSGAMEIRYVRDIGAFFQGDISEDRKAVGQIFFGVW